MNPAGRIARLVLAVWFGLVSVLPAQADPFWFRYAKGGLIEQQPTAEKPRDYEITARFIGVVGLPFESTVPAKPGALVSSWEIVEGVLPDGLSFDDDTGLVSGTPTEATEGRKLAVTPWSEG